MTVICTFDEAIVNVSEERKSEIIQTLLGAVNEAAMRCKYSSDEEGEEYFNKTYLRPIGMEIFSHDS